MKTLSVEDLKTKQDNSSAFTLIDVRSPEEYKGQHIPFAENLPLDQVTPEAVQSIATEGDELIFVCHSGGRSSKACEKLQQAGGPKASTVEGGTSAWAKKGYPTEEVS